MWSVVIVAGFIIMILSYQCMANQTETIPHEPIQGQDLAVYPPNPSRGESDNEDMEVEEGDESEDDERQEFVG